MRRGLDDFLGFLRPRSLASAPVDRRERPAARERSGSAAEPSESAARAAPGGRLETVQKVLTAASWAVGPVGPDTARGPVRLDTRVAKKGLSATGRRPAPMLAETANVRERLPWPG
jgi:hypothetical protein